VGVTDGANTEIVAGEIAPDARVIIGGGPKTSGPAAPRPPGFRMF
jgi:hypothetical protein